MVITARKSMCIVLLLGLFMGSLPMLSMQLGASAAAAAASSAAPLPVGAAAPAVRVALKAEDSAPARLVGPHRGILAFVLLSAAFYIYIRPSWNKLHRDLRSSAAKRVNEAAMLRSRGIESDKGNTDSMHSDSDTNVATAGREQAKDSSMQTPDTTATPPAGVELTVTSGTPGVTFTLAPAKPAVVGLTDEKAAEYFEKTADALIKATKIVGTMFKVLRFFSAPDGDWLVAGAGLA